MKKVLLVLMMLTFTFSNAQLTTREDTGVKLGKKNGVSCTQYGELYVFTYKDMKYQEVIENKSFKFSEQEFNDFNATIITTFDICKVEKIKKKVIELKTLTII